MTFKYKMKKTGKKTGWVSSFITGIVICSICILASVKFPEFKFPKPTGKFAVGTKYFLLKDNSRSGLKEDTSDDKRTISVRVWYPAQKPADGKPIAYQNQDSIKGIAQLFRIPFFLLNYLTQIETHSFENALLPEIDTRFPVIIFSPSGWMNHTTAVNEELASHGFVVFAVGHALSEPCIYDANGVVKIINYYNLYNQKLREELNSNQVESIKDRIINCTDIKQKKELHQQLNASQPLNVKDIQMRAQDISFLMDTLPELNTELFSGKLDLDHIGVMGFSKGGATAGELCVVDERIKAGLNMDGFMYGKIVENPIKVPFMYMHSVSAIESAFINDWFYQETKNSAYMLKIKGTVHSNYGDFSLFDGIFKEQGILGPIDGQRCVEIQRAYVLAFFNKHLKDEPSDLLSEGSTAYPEVEFFMRISTYEQ